MTPEQPKQTSNVSLEDLPDILWQELRSLDEDYAERSLLYALIDMGRIRDDLRAEVAEKIEAFKHVPLFDDRRYQQLKWFGPILVSDPDGDDGLLLNGWGGCNGDIVSAWIVRKKNARHIPWHLRQNAFAYGKDNMEYALRYYDPHVIPILHRLADRKWAKWFFAPFTAWWYPVATPIEETWSRIAGEERMVAPFYKVPLVITEELMEALVNDPFPYRLLNFAEQKYPSFFEGDCYGVRLAKVESLLEKGKEQGLRDKNDLIAYVFALLEQPGRVKEPRWQEAIQKTVAGFAPLKNYFVA